MINTKRDIAILQKLGSFGILSTRQVGKLFFPGVDATTVRRRLRVLEKGSLIYRVAGLDDGGIGWALAMKGSKAIAMQHQLMRFNRNSIRHDVLLNDVRLSLEEVGIGKSWIPEHVLKRRQTANKKFATYDDVLVPDALFSVLADNKLRIIALELELNSKNHKRYERLFQRYLRMKNIWALWYIVPSASAGESLWKLWNSVNGGKRNDLLIWSVLDEVLVNPREAIIYSGHFKLLSRELFTLPALAPALPEGPHSPKTSTPNHWQLRRN